MADYLYRIYLPENDDSEDVILRMPNEARLALRKLLGSMSYNDIMSRGVSDEERILLQKLRDSLD